MKLGELFTKLWFCAVPDPEYKCNPEYPCLDETPVCGFRWQASFIPEDFAQIENDEIVPAKILAELQEKVEYLSGLVAIQTKGDIRNAAADKILADTNMDAGIREILDAG